MRTLLPNEPAHLVAVTEREHIRGLTREELHQSYTNLGGTDVESFDAQISRNIKLGLMVEMSDGKIATSWVGWAAYRYGYSTNPN